MKISRSGAIEISVPAQIMAQSTPDSGAPKIDKPTVSGRLFSVLVTINGHKKLFQCVLIETNA